MDWENSDIINTFEEIVFVSGEIPTELHGEVKLVTTFSF